MSKLSILGKEYNIPELTFEHAEILENESGLSLYDLVFGKNTMSAARVFVQIVTGEDADTAKSMLNQLVIEQGYPALGKVVNQFVESLCESDFFAALLGLPKKGEPKTQEKQD